MSKLAEKIANCVERGKVDKSSPYPPDMQDLDGADELTARALKTGIEAKAILAACNEGMARVGEKFSRKEIFVPEMLMSAKAMRAVMAHLKPCFRSGSVKRKGTFVIGTVAGDLHDIGKNLVAMIVEGNGWEVVDIGMDVHYEKFIETIQKNPSCVVGLSAMLTTTMVTMSQTVKEIKTLLPDTNVIVGGAPLTEAVAQEMGADGYAPDPQGAVEFLNRVF